MNKKEKFLLNKFEESVDISPDFSKIENKIVIKKKEKKNKLLMMKLNFAQTVIATILLVGIIVPVTLIVEETVNSSTGLPSNLQTSMPSEEISYSENMENSSIVNEEYDSVSDDELALNPGGTSVTYFDIISINNISYGLAEISYPQQDIPATETLEKEQVIKIDNYDVYLSLSIAYNHERNTWYKLILLN